MAMYGLLLAVSVSPFAPVGWGLLCMTRKLKTPRLRRAVSAGTLLALWVLFYWVWNSDPKTTNAQAIILGFSIALANTFLPLAYLTWKGVSKYWSMEEGMGRE
jgi:hypothetical protein